MAETRNAQLGRGTRRAGPGNWREWLEGMGSGAVSPGTQQGTPEKDGTQNPPLITCLVTFDGVKITQVCELVAGSGGGPRKKVHPRPSKHRGRPGI